MTIALIAAATVLLLTFATLFFLQRLTPPELPPAVESPVGWIADEVWLRLNPSGFLARRVVAVQPGPVVIDPHLTPAVRDDHLRVPQMLVRSDAEMPPTGTIDEQRERLLTTPGAGQIKSAIWPVCCDRLGTLISCQQNDLVAEIEASAGPLDRAFLCEELNSWGGPNADVESFRDAGWSEVLGRMRSGAHSGMGINIFQCRACGRIYVASCAP